MGEMQIKKAYEGKNVVITSGLCMMGSTLAHKLDDLNANVLFYKF